MNEVQIKDLKNTSLIEKEIDILVNMIGAFVIVARENYYISLTTEESKIRYEKTLWMLNYIQQCLLIDRDNWNYEYSRLYNDYNKGGE